MFQKTTFEHNSTINHGDYAGFNFGCATEPEGGKIQLVNSTHTCREGLFYNMRNRICGTASNQPTDKMRMIFNWHISRNSPKKIMENNTDWAMRATLVIQAFDKIAGWPLTRVYKLDVGDKDYFLQSYYFHSSRRWMKASYLVSLYVLLVRMCKDERVTGFKDFDGLVKVIQKILKSGQTLKLDAGYVSSSLPYWEAIMKGYPDLFRQRKIQYYWDTGRLDGATNGGAEGVEYLVNGNTRYTEVRKEMLKIKKELDSKKS